MAAMILHAAAHVYGHYPVIREQVAPAITPPLLMTAVHTETPQLTALLTTPLPQQSLLQCLTAQSRLTPRRRQSCRHASWPVAGQEPGDVWGPCGGP